LIRASAMNVSDFDFELPDELIAQQALPRGESRLLVVDRASGARRHGTIADLPSILVPGDLLVVNNTRVFAARLLGHRVPSGGSVECLLLGFPHSGEPRLADALMHPGQKLRAGSIVRFEGPDGVLMGEVVSRHFHGRRTIRLWAESGGDVDHLIDALGHVPLPPYIKRTDTDADRERYQTVYARVRGSVAAPTAGLHFTPEILSQCREAGADIAQVTLHVGLGTFQPMHGEAVANHKLHTERYDISLHNEAKIRAASRRVAVGTTSVRTLESAARQSSSGETELFILPGFDFRMTGAMLTNFHLPRTSLLLLVCAFAGKDLALSAYRHAVEERYRFYSYGDCMLIV